ncbi:MAG: hypothetical protein ACI9TH_000422 [Kiritimatiellia bacterium]|jgi:hypothetical protein
MELAGLPAQPQLTGASFVPQLLDEGSGRVV